MARERDEPPQAVPAPAAWLGAAGTLPFIGAAVAVWLGSPWTAELAGRIAAAYGAVILSFLGGTFWGFAARPVQREGASQPVARTLFALSVVPSLVAWIAVLLAPQVALIILAIAFAAMLALDYWSWANGWTPSWWMRLRVPLSVVVVLCVTAIAAAPQT
jgi:hypothetical protein